MTKDIKKQLTIILGSLHSITPTNDKCSKKELKAAINRVNKLIEDFSFQNLPIVGKKYHNTTSTGGAYYCYVHGIDINQGKVYVMYHENTLISSISFDDFLAKWKENEQGIYIPKVGERFIDKKSKKVVVIKEVCNFIEGWGVVVAKNRKGLLLQDFFNKYEPIKE